MRGLFSLVCGVQPVRVIYGDGEVLYLPPGTTVEEVLQSYPHHFVCQSSNSNQMLALDAELRSGCIYFLLPVPRLFPAAPSQSPQCRCYVSAEEADQPVSSPLRVYSSPQRFGGLGFRSPRGSRKSKVQPESDLYSAGRAEEPARPVWRNCPWRPRLGCISEEDDLELALEELRYHGFMRKRETPPNTCANPQLKSASGAPAKKLPPPQLKPSKSARIVADAEVEWNSATAGIPTMIAIC